MKHPIEKAADYYEPLFRARVVRALKAVRASVSVKDIALAIAHKNPSLVHIGALKPALAPAQKVIRDAFNQGGKVGAQVVRDLK